ncbi:hypothetical protein CEXT_442861 [Caerostris extrusa]|uniref:Uncharacterized protein n=1 Tax=Caerostris extrusa TaxID=172846 RepID=A0AAV4Y4T2_CAEEX|nr:hypothetical protein CEXT_442861 [Caerostris extrusa]
MIEIKSFNYIKSSTDCIISFNILQRPLALAVVNHDNFHQVNFCFTVKLVSIDCFAYFQKRPVDSSQLSLSAIHKHEKHAYLRQMWACFLLHSAHLSTSLKEKESYTLQAGVLVQQMCTGKNYSNVYPLFDSHPFANCEEKKEVKLCLIK